MKGKQPRPRTWHVFSVNRHHIHWKSYFSKNAARNVARKMARADGEEYHVLHAAIKLIPAKRPLKEIDLGGEC